MAVNPLPDMVSVSEKDFRIEAHYYVGKVSTVIRDLRSLLYDHDAVIRLESGEIFRTSENQGYYKRWRFSKEFYCKDMLFTLVGETNCSKDCYTEFPLIRGREPEATDPGHAALIIEGNIPYNRDGTTIADVIGIAIPETLNRRLQQ